MVGELTADGFYIQHPGRKVVVGMPREEIIHITLVCDRCKETVDLKIAPNERKNAELSIK